MEGVIVYLRLVSLAEGVHFVPLGQKGGFEGGVLYCLHKIARDFSPNEMFLFYFWVLENFCEESPVIILDIIASCIVEAVFF